MDNKYILDFLEKNHKFKVMETKEGKVELVGKVVLNHKNKDSNIKLYKELNIRIKIDENYPQVLPKAYDEEEVLSRNYHINGDGSLCLGTDIDIRIKLMNDYSLENWVEKLVMPFIYSSEYYTRYGESPFGERSHGTLGILESFKELFDLENDKQAYFLIVQLSRRKYRRIFDFNKKIKNKKCPCGSGKNIYSCHLVGMRTLETVNKKHKKDFKNIGELFLKYRKDILGGKV